MMLKMLTRSRGWRPAVALMLCASMTAACYRSVALPTATPAPETRIVVGLTAVGAEQMAPQIGADAVELEADVVRWGETEAELSLRRVDYRGPRSVLWNGERVVFPVGMLRDPQQRSLHRGRTTAFVAGVAAVATVLAIVFIRFVAGGDEGGGPGTDPVE